MRTTHNGDAVRRRNLMPVPRFVDRVETVTGYIICGFIYLVKDEPFLFTCRREGSKRVSCCMNLPPVNPHDKKILLVSP
jgi:hypothetical protein